MTYREFFASIFGSAESAERQDGRRMPYRYQELLAAEPWPDMLDIPTGLGKTAAVTTAWLYRRLHEDADTPRRLVWCLPMRVLVEQTHANVKQWLAQAAPLFEAKGLAVPRSFLLMGGEADDSWASRPEDPAVLIGTQDMLLSRALMRGYGASRYRWPLDFALLHSDTLWVFDEVQLMGAGLPTSSQLEAFRRDPAMPPVLPSRTLWASATLNRDWFATIDFRAHLPGCRVLDLPAEDRQDPRVLKRLAADKQLVQAAARLNSARKPDVKAYIEALCDDVVASHAGDAPTLVIVNRVGRAQDVYRRLRDRLARDSGKTEVLLVHARFRAAERAALNARVRVVRPDDNIVIVATQAVEAGVDITSRHLFTELAPWSSLVQRFGRCNRGGEYADAMVHWLDIETDADAQLALPYDAAAMNEARGRLGTLDSAASAHLPPVTERPDTPHVLRRKDLLDLFNTEPDLSGFDIDISPYLRDPGGAQVQIFWRAFGVQPEGQKRPDRSELCPAPIGAAREHLKATKRRAHVWNTLAARWEGIDQADIRPGQTLLVQADAGGYSSELGFVAASKERVEPVALAEETAAADPDSMDAAAETVAADFVELAGHLLEAKRQAESLAEKLPMAGAGDEVVTAALWHDIGKSHPAFQTALLADAGDDVDRSTLWAKSPDARRQLKYSVVIDGQVQSRRHFRHELASMLAWLEVGAGASSASLTRVGAETPNASRGDDLVAYLIAAHHGKVRMALRSLPNETRPEDNRLFARGIWAGDELPSLAVNGLRLPAITLRLDVMQLGVGEMGPSWSARTAGLLAHWGPFRLAWLESMVRLADWRASAVVGDWDAGTWEGSRRAQLQRAARLTVRERLEALESMADTSARLSDIRDEHTVRPVSPNPDPATNEIIREMVDRIVSRFHPLRVIVFGSRARGTAHAGSDVDLLVVFADVKNKRQTTIEIRRALGDLPLSKDVIVTTPAELALRGELVGSVLRSALLEGQVVYDRP